MCVHHTHTLDSLHLDKNIPWLHHLLSLVDKVRHRLINIKSQNMFPFYRHSQFRYFFWVLTFKSFLVICARTWSMTRKFYPLALELTLILIGSEVLSTYRVFLPWTITFVRNWNFEIKYEEEQSKSYKNHFKILSVLCNRKPSINIFYIKILMIWKS